MKKSCSFLWFFSVWTVLTLFPLSRSEAREDTAHLNLRKTAIYGGNVEKYVVQRGDSIDKIAQKFIGKSSRRYLVIKQLNPQLKNLNRIYPGQPLVLPGRVSAEKEAVSSASPTEEKVVSYQVKKGDSVTRILKRQLHVKMVDLPEALRLVQQLNPGISDLNRIRTGQTILLPAADVINSPPGIASPENPESNSSKIETERKLLVPPQKEMNLLRQLISRSHGTLISRGNYFIPLPETGRMTLDCSAMPIVEFDDGSTVVLDFADRVPASLQKLIEMNWKNYHIVKVRSSWDIFLIFQSAINASASYTASKCLNPLMLEKKPQVMIDLDWLVTQKKPVENKPRFHGIILASDKSQLLPARFHQYAWRSGYELTQILNGEVSYDSSATQSSPALEVPSLAADNPMDFTFNLLVQLGYSPLKNREVELFDKAGDGFHLSVKADILLRTAERELLISSKKLSKELVEILSRRQKEVVIIDSALSRNEVLSRIMSVLHTPFSSGQYKFSIAAKDGSKAILTISLPAFRIDRQTGPLYLIDYDLDGNLYTLLHETWKLEIARY